MRKTNMLLLALAFAMTGLATLYGCTVTECGDGVCEGAEDCEFCPEDCGQCSDCGNGTCDSGETCTSCPDDCGQCTGPASISINWYIHGIQGGVNVGWGTGEAQEVCELVQAVTAIPVPPRVQIWIEDTGDDTADFMFDFPACNVGTGRTTDVWESGDQIKYAFALVDGNDNLLSVSQAWETMTLAGGINDLGTVNFYIANYGPLGVDLEWADKTADPAFFDCDLEPEPVSIMGYLLCWGSLSGGECPDPDNNLYDIVDIDVDPASCVTRLAWDITDYGTYTLVIDGEDAAGATVWGFECQDLVVDEMEPLSNEFTCQVLMTASP